MPLLRPWPGAPPATETSVIVVVQEAEPLVRAARQRYDASSGRGVPAHVTVLHPFVHPERVTGPLVEELAAVVAAVPAFACSFGATRWFDDRVLWLDPDPAAGFRALTAAVSGAFAGQPPHEGRSEVATPHLTVARDAAWDLPGVRAVERRVRRGLPVSTYVDRAVLVAGSSAPRSWRVLHELPLGPPDDPRG